MGGVYSHNNNKLNKTKMLSEKNQKFKNSGTSTQTIDTPNLNINVRILAHSHCCHHQSILTLNLTLNKIQYANPCYSSKKIKKLNDFAPFSYFLVFWSNCLGGGSIHQKGASNTNLTLQRGCYLHKRVLLESGHLLDHLW